MDARFGRNDPCQCGSGKKYKRCCLDQDAAARSAELQAERDQLSLDLGAGDWRSDEEDEDDPFVESRTGYDPEIPPDPTRWLAIDEELRIDAIRRWHHHQHLPQPNHRLHATLHTIARISSRCESRRSWMRWHSSATKGLPATTQSTRLPTCSP